MLAPTRRGGAHSLYHQPASVTISVVAYTPYLACPACPACADMSACTPEQGDARGPITVAELGCDVPLDLEPFCSHYAEHAPAGEQRERYCLDFLRMLPWCT